MSVRNTPFPWPALRAWAEDAFDLIDPMALVAILAVLIIIVVLPARPGTTAQPTVIIVTATVAAGPAPGNGQGLARKLPVAPDANWPAPTAPHPTTQPAAETEQPVVVFVAPPTLAPQPSATLTPVPAPAAAPAPTMPVTVYTWNADGTLLSVYQCRPYGDWRDSDPMYLHPECAPKR